MKKNIICLFVLLFAGILSAQQTFYTASWNVENLFDTTDDPSIDDSEFLPASEKNWDNKKYELKLENLSAVIKSMNEGKGPDLLGLVEVENINVVKELVNKIGEGYSIVHRESPDGRGIDNALLYRTNLFSLWDVRSDTIHLEGDEKTRSILECTFNLPGGEKLVVFVNHWPSRRGGDSSEFKRIKAALTLKNRLNELKSNSFTIIMGDFNDEPENKSIDSVLNAGMSPKNIINPAYEFSKKGEGTYKYRDEWNMLDQIMFEDKSFKVDYEAGSFHIYKPEFMMTQSGAYKGVARPTFAGKKYLAGYSDHFPVIAKFIISR